MKYEYGMLVELHWQGKPKYMEEILSKWRSVHHKFHMAYLWVTPRAPWSETDDWLPEPWQDPNKHITKGKFMLSLYSSVCNPHLHKFLLMVYQLKYLLGVWSRQGKQHVIDI
jgi:hypothetical protein